MSTFGNFQKRLVQQIPLVSVFMLCMVTNQLAGQAFTNSAPITAQSLTPDGLRMIKGSTDGIVVYSWPEEHPLQRLPTKLAYIHDLQFSSCGQRLLAAGGQPGEAGSLEVWSWPTAELVLSVEPHDDVIFRARWTNGDDRIVTASFDHRCIVIDAVSGNLLHEFLGHSRPVLALGLLPGGQAVSGGVDQSLRVWNLDDGQSIREMNHSLGAIVDLIVVPVAAETTTQAAAAPPSQPAVVTIGADRAVRLWHPNQGRMVRFVKLDQVPEQITWIAETERIVIVGGDRRWSFDRFLNPDEK